MGKRLTKSKMGVLTSVSVNQTKFSLYVNHIREARLVGEGTWLGDKHARSHRLLAYQRDEKGRRLPRTQDTGGVPPVAPSPTHLLMYSAFSCFPQVLHLKQPKCQCLSKATRDWPFLISVPQPPQPGRKMRTQTSTAGPEQTGPGLLVCRHD